MARTWVGGLEGLGLSGFAAFKAAARLSPVELHDSSSEGMVVAPPTSPRSPGVVCYTLSPGSTPTSPRGSSAVVPVMPAPLVGELVSVFPDTPETGSKTRTARRPRPPPPPLAF